VLGSRRIGHLGTLDPFATGLLVLLVGRATRLARFIDGEPKVYEAMIRFGNETDTDDSTGAVTREAVVPPADRVDAAIAQLTGPLDQTPPAFSAKQSGGVRAYAAARKGTPLELPPSRVTVHRWTILGRDDRTLSARIECSGGTYIRALGRDLGRLAGSAAHIAALRRIAAGRFTLADSSPLEAVREGRGAILGMRDAISQLPVQELSADERGKVSHGNAIAATIAGERAALIGAGGELAAIADRVGDAWQPTAVFTHE
jgi:tRNA pseudouridine55 synthase